jgi:hypothetical protein
VEITMSDLPKEIPIVCPSHKRANRVRAKRAVAGVIICVEEAQAAEYREHNPDVEIVTHPNEVKGLVMKRQWMKDHFKALFMIDDDCVQMNRLWAVPDSLPIKVMPDEARRIIQADAVLAKDLGCALFGFAPSATIYIYSALKPFAFNRVLNGAFMGVLDSPDIYFHPDFVTGHDHFVSLLSLHKHRIVLTDSRFSFVNGKTMGHTGGLAEQRTMEVEKRIVPLMRKFFGDVVQYKQPRKLNAGIHPYQRHYTIPL